MRDMHLRSSRLKQRLHPDGIRAQGFSMIELLVAMAVASIVVAALYSVYAVLTKSYTTQNVAADIQQAVRAGVDFMAEDIMMAGLDHERSATAAIISAAATNLRFTADRNMNGTIDNTDFEDINYFLNGTQLMQRLYGDNTTDESLVENVTNLTFTYFDGANPPNELVPPLSAADLADIRTVVISMTVREPAGRGGPIMRTYSTQVRCRNLGL